MRRIATAVAVSALVTVMAAPSVLAVGQRIPVEADLVGALLVQPPAETVPGHTGKWNEQWREFVYQARNIQSVEFLVGSRYLQGSAAGTIDLTAHFSCTDNGCQVVGGSVRATWNETLDAIDGGWTGTAAGVITGQAPTGDFLYTLSLAASGWGELDGWHFQGSSWTSWEPSEGLAKSYSGYVVGP